MPVNPEAAESLLATEFLGQAYRTAVCLLKMREELAPAIAAHQDRNPRTGDGYTVHKGIADIRAAIRLSVRECQREIVAFQAGGARRADDLADAQPDTVELLDRGVEMKVIYQHSARSNAAVRRYVRTAQEHGAQVRSLDESFESALVFDRQVAFVPSAGDRGTVVELRLPPVVSFLTGLFERHWRRARPFTPPGRDSGTLQITDELELAIMRYVVAGEKDSVTAQHLGISVRRCQDYIARMSRRLGSRSRAQLGYLIAKSGVLDREPPSRCQVLEPV
ncbi:hypothetical protein [Streptomyces sulfonofaciens]|uniref:hypothetical protein n=1 Tax=Streptomyces sulfonofaciens TaxID=68272 RepID=UPI0016765501|nr:hypothetical protein [Streptomyces sulfonofaciens]